MKLINIKFLLNYLALAVLCIITMVSCEQEDPNLIDYSAGDRLAISGPSEVRVGDANVSYHLINNRKDVDYAWTAQGASLTENTDNDAFVTVSLFDSPGVYDLEVSGGEATGAKSVEVVSREVQFETESVTTSESVENDTITIPLSIAGGFNSDFTVTYSISGSMDEANYDVLPGYESPYTVEADTVAGIKLVVYPEADLTDTADLVLTIQDVQSSLEEEYVGADTLQSISYSFVDDLKEVSLDTTEFEISQPGVYSFPVSLSSAAGEEMITVNYSIAGAGVGVTDATATGTPGSLRFAAGQTEREITLSVSELAFAADQTVTVTLDGMITEDAEASLSDDMNSKTIQISGN